MVHKSDKQDAGTTRLCESACNCSLECGCVGVWVRACVGGCAMCRKGIGCVCVWVGVFVSASAVLYIRNYIRYTSRKRCAHYS